MRDTGKKKKLSLSPQPKNPAIPVFFVGGGGLQNEECHLLHRDPPHSLAPTPDHTPDSGVPGVTGHLWSGDHTMVTMPPQVRED